MKRSIVVALCLALLPGIASAEWYASGVVTNPAANDVILEAVATTDQQTTFCVDAHSSVSATFRVQHRNTANSATVKEQLLSTALGASGQYCTKEMQLNTDERVRVIMNAGVIGTVSVSMTHAIY